MFKALKRQPMLAFYFVSELLEEVIPLQSIEKLSNTEQTPKCTERMTFHNGTLVQSSNDCDEIAVEDVQTNDFIICSVSSNEKEKGQLCNSVKGNFISNYQ
jgi:hypothetical protein